jgi:hypothetical protein
MQWAAHPQGSVAAVDVPIVGDHELLHEVSRMADYMVRAQQLIGLLAAQRKQTPQVQEAMRRVDWEKVQIQFADSVENCRRLLHKKET